MSFNRIFSSSYSEHRWVDRISKHFEKDVVIDINDVPVSVFNVPKSISEVKPEAYVPQVIALGPYHHLRPEFYQMERYKVAAVRGILNEVQIINFQHLVVDRLKELEPTIRACYHKYLDLDDDTLAWIISIDGLFLLDLLRNYANGNKKTSEGGRRLTQDAILYRDVMVLENQIPFVLLKEIRKTIRFSSLGDDFDFDSDDELFHMMKCFCKAHSPLKSARKSDLPSDTSPLHLLDLMYHLIVNHRATIPVPPKPGPEKVLPKMEETKKEDLIHNVGDIMEVGMSLGIGGKVLKPLEVIKNLPWENISNLLGLKTDNKTDNEKCPLVEEIKIPSVSNLSNYGGIKFSHTVGGIRDIKFIEEEATLYLPVLTVNANFEVVLRNLVAYEAATLGSSRLELAEYVDLMSGIVDTPEDTKFLKEKGIIKSDLSNGKIADIFNGMDKSTTGCSQTVEKINKYYNRRSVVKAYRFVKKRLYDSWKALTLLSTIIFLGLLLMNSFCQVYGCPRLSKIRLD